MNYLASRSTLGAILLAWLLASACLGAEPPRVVSFATADGGTVFADAYGEGGRDGVVLAHGAAFDKASWRPFAEQVSAKGFRVLAIDFRGWGKSTAGSAKDARFEDVLAAVRGLRRGGAARVSVVGASMGGGAAAEAAVRAAPGEIDRLVLLSPAPVGAPERVSGDKLVVASEHEAALEPIKALYQKLPEPKRLVLLPGTAHAQHIFDTDQSGRLTATVIEFLSGPPATPPPPAR